MSPEKKNDPGPAVDVPVAPAAGPTPPVRQPHRYAEFQSAADCLALVLARHGHAVEPDEIALHLRASPHTGDIVNFLDVAVRFGLHGQPRILTETEWSAIPAGSILHWGPDGLVVCEEVHADGVMLYDPARGRRCADQAEFAREFTGVALVFSRVAGATV